MKPQAGGPWLFLRIAFEGFCGCAVMDAVDPFALCSPSLLLLARVLVLPSLLSVDGVGAGLVAQAADQAGDGPVIESFSFLMLMLLLLSSVT